MSELKEILGKAVVPEETLKGGCGRGVRAGREGACLDPRCTTPPAA